MASAQDLWATGTWSLIWPLIRRDQFNHHNDPLCPRCWWRFWFDWASLDWKRTRTFGSLFPRIWKKDFCCVLQMPMRLVALSFLWVRWLFWPWWFCRTATSRHSQVDFLREASLSELDSHCWHRLVIIAFEIFEYGHDVRHVLRNLSRLFLDALSLRSIHLHRNGYFIHSWTGKHLALWAELSED